MHGLPLASVYVNRRSRSCGFYISGTHITVQKDNWHLWGEPGCSSEYTDIAFGFTSTTYVDGNGDADGVTVFVAKNCTTGERFGPDQQDVKYSGNVDDTPILGFSKLPDEIYVGLDGDTLIHPARPGEGSAAPDPAEDDTCNRGCICGYSANIDQDITYPWPIIPAYSFCECDIWLSDYLWNYFYDAIDGRPFVKNIFATAANISLLNHYSVNYTGLVTTNSSTNTVPFPSPFECFGGIH